jgi:hypothetical protein
MKNRNIIFGSLFILIFFALAVSKNSLINHTLVLSATVILLFGFRHPHTRMTYAKKIIESIKDTCILITGLALLVLNPKNSWEEFRKKWQVY